MLTRDKGKVNPAAQRLESAPVVVPAPGPDHEPLPIRLYQKQSDFWVESLYTLRDLPLAERLRLRQEADTESAERAAAELLSEDVAAGAPASAPSSPAVKKAQPQEVSCEQCTRWHRWKSGAGYKYWTHEIQRLLGRDQIVKYDFNKSEIRL